MRAVETIAVIGAGTMGRGIAQAAATSGFEVRIVDADAKALSRSLAAIEEMLGTLVEKKKLLPAERGAALQRLKAAATIEDGVAGADLVVEAVPEELELKRRLFGWLDAAAPSHAILASNTSSLPIGKIAEATRRPGSCLGMHFFNPVPVMPLLEIVRTTTTSDETVAVALEVGRKLGKEPIVVRDAPGFATSRLGVLLGLEAIRMLEQRVATAEDIDKAMTLGYRHPMGPLRLTDLVGLDVRLAIAEHLHRELRSDAFRPPDLLRRMVADGKLGKKSGEGFYRWDA
ncbi:MAG TPA: 3-hydroxyacyl-CoA dehydrogenase family protein [Candidatus Polarisedimenticolaceae bacterium]|nr:3-hydroxyacyl-CoA dehydrogenase family protein [Candidatus Polarisedimenticolaceae bacterium]